MFGDKFEFSDNMHGSKGLIDLKGDTLLDPEYSIIYYTSDYIEVKSKGKYGVLNSHSRNVIIPFNFSYISYDDDGISLFVFYDTSGNKFMGYLNKNHKIIWSSNKTLFKKKLNR